jgi:integrase
LEDTMGVNIWINRGHVYLDVYIRGKKRRREKLAGLVLVGDKATDRETMRLAEIAKAKRAQQVFPGEWGLTDPIAGKQTLYQYIEKLSQKAVGKRKEAMQSVLKHLKSYRSGMMPMSQISDRWVEDLQDYLLCSLAPASAATYSGIIRAALRQAVKDKILSRDPAAEVKRIKVYESDKVWLSASEFDRLATTPLPGEIGDKVRRAFIFACYTGLRISDLKSLTWGDIEGQSLIKRQKKTKDKVYIPLNASAWSIINDGSIHDHREMIFPHLLTEKNNRYALLQKWAKQAGITKRIGWHTARHTFAILSLEAGVEIYTVSKLLGHASIKTTQVYAKATDKMKRAAVDALPTVQFKR